MKKTLLGLLIGLAATAYAALPVTMPINGGTGTSTKPSLGQILIGNANGLYNLVSTSSLGISGSLSGGTTGWLSYWTSPTTLSAVATGTAGSLLTASSTSSSGYDWTATSTLATALNYWTKLSNNLYYTGGNVGVGTSTPGYPLTVVGTSSIIGNFIVSGTSTLASTTVNGNFLQYKTMITVGASSADYITDGVSDEVQINQALTYANSIGGAGVCLKDGKYYTGNNINLLSNTSLSSCSGNKTAVTVYFNSASTKGVFINNSTSTSLYNISFDGSSQSAFNKVVDAVNVTDLLIDNINVFNAVGYGVFIEAEPNATSSKVTIQNSYIEGLGNNDVIGGGPQNASGTVTSLFVNNNYVVQNKGGGGTYFNVFDIVACNECKVQNNIFEGSVLFGYEVSPHNYSEFINNTIKVAKGRVFSVLTVESSHSPSPAPIASDKAIQISGNTIESGAISMIGVNGFRMRYVNITNNTIKACGSGLNCLFLNFVDTAVISNNIFQGISQGAVGSGYSGIYYSNSINLNIFGNSILNNDVVITDATGVSTVVFTNNFIDGYNTFASGTVLATVFNNKGYEFSNLTSWLGIGTTTKPTDALQVNGNATPLVTDSFGMGSSTRRWLNLFSRNIFASSSVLTNASTTGLTATNFFTSTINATGQTILANASATALTVSGLTNGSVLFATSSGLLSQNNSQFFWDNVNNRLGIGTNAPSQKLEVNGTLSMAGGGGFHIFATAGSGGEIQTFSSLPLLLNRQGNNVGIGETTPSSKLALSGGMAIGNTTAFSRATAPTGGLLVQGIGLFGTSTPTTSSLFVQGTTTLNPLTIASSTGTTLFQVLANGNVGIGTSTPSQTLTVNGTVQITGGSPAQGKVLLSDANGIASWVATSSLGFISGSGLTSLNGQTGSTQTFASSTSGTDFSITSSGNVHTFTLPDASASARGLLTSADWSTFTNKPSFSYASSTFPSFTYGSSTYMTYSYASSTYASTTFVTSNYVPYTGATSDVNLGTRNFSLTGSIASLASRVLKGWFTDIDTTNASSTNATTTNLTLRGLSSTFLAVDPNGLVIATTTPAGGSLSGGTTGLLALWSSASSLATSLFMDNGTVTGIGATSSTQRFNVASTTGTTMFSVGLNGQLTIATSTSATTTTTDINTSGVVKMFTWNPLPYLEKLFITQASSTPVSFANDFTDVAISKITPGSGTTYNLDNVGAVTSGCTVAKLAPSAVLNDIYASYRTRHSSVVTTPNQICGVYVTSETQFFRGSNTAVNAGGFRFFARVSIDNWTAGNRLFVGLTASTTPISGTSTLAGVRDTVGFGIHQGSTTLTVMTNDATGNVTETAIPGMPAVAQGMGYDLYLYAAPNSDRISWRVDDASTSQIISTGVLTTDLPTKTTMMRPYAAMSNATNTPANAAQFSIARIIIETRK